MIVLEDRILLHLLDGKRIPVNRVLPVSRRRISALWERFGE